MAHPARHLGAVTLDLHAPAAAVTELAAGHVAVDLLLGQLESGREPLDDAGEAGPVGLAGRDQAH